MRTAAWRGHAEALETGKYFTEAFFVGLRGAQHHQQALVAPRLLINLRGNKLAHLRQAVFANVCQAVAGADQTLGKGEESRPCNNRPIPA